MIMPSIGEKGMLGYNQLLKDKCSYEKYDGKNKYNEKSYKQAEDVKCFVSFDLSNILCSNAQDVNFNKVVFIGNEFEPSPFDKIDGLEIKMINPVKGLIVPIIGWEIVV